MSWDKDALCTGYHSELFFPPLFREERTAPEAQYYELGKLVCEHCDIREECAERGAEEEYGLWGGMSPKDRRLGRYRPNKTVLPHDSISTALPKHSDVPLYVPQLRMDVRKHLKRRPRAR